MADRQLWRDIVPTLVHVELSSGFLDYYLIEPPGLRLNPGARVIVFAHGFLHKAPTCMRALKKKTWLLGAVIIAPCTPRGKNGCHLMGSNAYAASVRLQLELIEFLYSDGKIGHVSICGISQGGAQTVTLTELLERERPDLLTRDQRPERRGEPVSVPINAPTRWPGADLLPLRLATSPWVLTGLVWDTWAGWWTGAAVSVVDGELTEFIEALSCMFISPAELLSAVNIMVTAPNITAGLRRLAKVGVHPVEIKSAVDSVAGGPVLALWAWLRHPQEVRLAFDFHTNYATGHGPAFWLSVFELAAANGVGLPEPDPHPLLDLSTLATAPIRGWSRR